MDPWLKHAVLALVSQSLPSEASDDSARILNYSLPCPVPVPVEDAAAEQQQQRGVVEGAPTCMPPSLIDAITRVIEDLYFAAGKTPSIQVSHALPATFSLLDVPSTPPSTVGTPSSSHQLAAAAAAQANANNQDYFAPRATATTTAAGYASPFVFNSAVPIHDLSGSTVYTGPTSFDDVVDKSGNDTSYVPCLPLLPPSSLHMSLVERYIPATVREDTSLFTPQTSVLWNRVSELSLHGGCLMFIYPTKQGARDFARKLLNPVLSPVLRSMMVLDRLTTNTCEAIDTIPGLDGMLEFETLQQKMLEFCAGFAAHHHGGPARVRASKVSVIYASKQLVRLDSRMWPVWWAHQEAARVELIMERHCSLLAAKKKPAAAAAAAAGSTTNRQAPPPPAPLSTNGQASNAVPPPQGKPRLPKVLDNPIGILLAAVSASTEAAALPQDKTCDVLVREIIDAVKRSAGPVKPSDGTPRIVRATATPAQFQSAPIEVAVFVLQRRGVR